MGKNVLCPRPYPSESPSLVMLQPCFFSSDKESTGQLRAHTLTVTYVHTWKPGIPYPKSSKPISGTIWSSSLDLSCAQIIPLSFAYAIKWPRNSSLWEIGMELGVSTCMHMRPLMAWDSSRSWKNKGAVGEMSAGASNPHTSIFWSRTPKKLSILY